MSPQPSVSISEGAYVLTKQFLKLFGKYFDNIIGEIAVIIISTDI